MSDISENSNVIDSREVITCIEELQTDIATCEEEIEEAEETIENREEEIVSLNDTLAHLNEDLTGDLSDFDRGEITTSIANYKDDLNERKDEIDNAQITIDTARATMEAYQDELKPLQELAEEAEGYCPDWYYGAPLINDNYFAEYAEELATDCGMVTNVNEWPNMHIDWDAAAQSLQVDYTSVSFGDSVFWVR